MLISKPVAASARDPYVICCETYPLRRLLDKVLSGAWG
jgi:hypothetical protein